MILFGVRSPLACEYEETCHRLGLTITAAVSLNGIPRLVDRSVVIELDAFLSNHAGDVFLACAFAPTRRAALVKQAADLGLTLAPALVDPTAITARTVRVGDGTFINAGCVIGALSILGEGVLVNRATSLGHHTILGDFVSIGPGATLAGNVHVGAGAMIGAGSVILPDVRIGEGALVAAGSVVRRNVPDGAYVAGQPAVEKLFDPARSSLHVEDGE